MANKQKKKKFVKRSLYDRTIYYLDKATKKNATDYDMDFAIGYLQGVDNEKADSKMSKKKGYVDGYLRGSNARETSKRINF